MSTNAPTPFLSETGVVFIWRSQGCEVAALANKIGSNVIHNAELIK